MKAKTKQRKKKPNIKVIAGIVGAILVIGIVGGNGDSAQSETTTADNMPTIEAGINISDETISMEVVKNTEEDTTSSEALTEAPTIEETTEEMARGGGRGSIGRRPVRLFTLRRLQAAQDTRHGILPHGKEGWQVVDG